MNAPTQLAQVAQVATTAIEQPSQTFDLSPRTFEQALTFSNYLADSDLVPKDFKGKPGNCLIAMQWGAEIGLKPLQAMQNLAIINGRPSLWGDAVIALVRASPLCEYVIEEDDGNVATCRTKRRGAPHEQIERFGVEDAAKAGLTGKAGPWTQYPKRMRKMRARAFLLRDVYADVLRGLPVAEELMDMPPAERYMGPVEEVAPPAPATPALPAYAQADFVKNLPQWRGIVDSGRKTAADLLATLSTKATFSEEQKKQILKLGAAAAAPAQTAQASAEHADFVDAMDNAEAQQ